MNTVTTTHTCNADRYDSRPCRACFAENVQVGDFVQYTMVTDTQVYEVMGKTAKTLQLRTTVDGERMKSENVDGNPYPLVYVAVESWDGTQTETVRLRKDGTYRMASWANPIRFAECIDGKPVRFTDYRI